MVEKGGDLSGPAGICGDLSGPAGICGYLWASVGVCRDLSGFTLWDTLQSGCGARRLPPSSSHQPRAKFSQGLVVRPCPTLRMDGLPCCEHWMVLIGSLANAPFDHKSSTQTHLHNTCNLHRPLLYHVIPSQLISRITILWELKLSLYFAFGISHSCNHHRPWFLMPPMRFYRQRDHRAFSRISRTGSKLDPCRKKEAFSAYPHYYSYDQSPNTSRIPLSSPVRIVRPQN